MNPLAIIASHSTVPSLVASAGDRASRRHVEFFTASIRNKGTRQQYAHAVRKFCEWCEEVGISFDQIQPIVIVTYVELLGQDYSAPTVKLHLAAIRMWADFMVTGHVFEFNPASSVRGPMHVVKKGKTPVLTPEEARELLDSIDISTIKGLRDRALIGVMVYSFARISATLGMNVEDCFQQGRSMWFRLHEKGGKRHEVPAHHNAEAYVDEYIQTAGIEEQRRMPLFRTVGPRKMLTENRMHRTDALRMIKRRSQSIGLPGELNCHTFRATGITAYLKNGGTIEKAMQIAAHESARTTKLYDRTNDELSLDEIERVII